MTRTFGWKAERRERVTVISLRGAMTLEALAPVREELLHCLTSEAPDLVFDLTALDFIASDGLGALLAACRRTRELGGRARLAAPTPLVRQVFTLLRLDRVMPICNSVEDALHSLRSN